VAKVLASPTSMRMRVPVLTPIPGIDVRSCERGWASSRAAICRSRAARWDKYGARDDEGGEDVLDQALGHPGCLGPDQGDQAAAPGGADQGRGAVSLQDGQDCGVLDARAQDAFQRGVDLSEQAAQPVGGAGDLAGEVVVESGEHVQFGDGFVGGCQGASKMVFPAGVRPRPWCSPLPTSRPRKTATSLISITKSLR
jgi:hypothetical protein